MSGNAMDKLNRRSGLRMQMPAQSRSLANEVEWGRHVRGVPTCGEDRREMENTGLKRQLLPLSGLWLPWKTTRQGPQIIFFKWQGQPSHICKVHPAHDSSVCRPGYSKCGPGTSAISITWEPARVQILKLCSRFLHRNRHL